MKGTLLVLARLLDYPAPELRRNMPELHRVLRRENALSASRQAELEVLMDVLLEMDTISAETAYVDLFDRGRRTSLHLFEHVHGDSRERGPAMLDLRQTYEEAGLEFMSGELPDFLPAVLEFVSSQPRCEASAFLGEISHIVNALFVALMERGSAYAYVMGALLDLAGEEPRPLALAPEPTLDESWAEPEPFAGCSTHGQSAPEQPVTLHFVPKGTSINSGAEK
ncbi:MULTISPECIES: nitrate reductase molybdenum cofactor assembly chaperone [Thauera]|nr:MULTISPECIES: nitrate reductase molybdenum cofactor assembly chaperone [Thauera]